MAKITEMQQDNNNIHPSYKDEDYIKNLKSVDFNKDYSENMEKFHTLVKDMSEEELDEKISQLQKSLDYVEESLNTQKYKRTRYLPSNVLKKTAFTKGLLEDQLAFAKHHKHSLIPNDKIEEI